MMLELVEWLSIRGHWNGAASQSQSTRVRRVHRCWRHARGGGGQQGGLAVVGGELASDGLICTSSASSWQGCCRGD